MHNSTDTVVWLKVLFIKERERIGGEGEEREEGVDEAWREIKYW